MSAIQPTSTNQKTLLAIVNLSLLHFTQAIKGGVGSDASGLERPLHIIFRQVTLSLNTLNNRVGDMIFNGVDLKLYI
jgi:hypothetical protein